MEVILSGCAVRPGLRHPCPDLRARCDRVPLVSLRYHGQLVDLLLAPCIGSLVSSIQGDATFKNLIFSADRSVICKGAANVAGLIVNWKQDAK